MAQAMGRRRTHTPPMTRMTTTVTTLLVLAHFTPWASGFSIGAPDTTCGNLEPAHGVPRQSTPAPYTLTPSAVEIEGGKQMLVTLEATGGTAFKGFLLQARNSDTQEVVGTFFTTDHKYLNCENGMNNAVTHQGPTSKSKVTLTWEAPSDFSGDVVFIGSFVQQRSVFWVGVTSEKVTVKRATREAPPPPPPPAEAAPETTTTTTTTTTTPPPSVSPSTEPGSGVNAGDLVISVVDAPSSDVVDENDVNAGSEGESSAPTTLPPSPSPSPSVTPIIPTPSKVSTESSEPSEANTGDEEAVEEEEEEEPLPDEPTSPKPARNTPKRKFGLLGRRRTSSTTSTSTTTSTTTTTASPREPSQGLSPVSSPQDAPVPLPLVSLSRFY